MKLNAIKEIDIFGPRIELRLGKKKSHKTLCGATMTIFVIVCCITAFIIIGKELIQKDDPNVKFRQILSDEFKDRGDSELSEFGSLQTTDLKQLSLSIGIKNENGMDIQSQFRDKIKIQINYVEKDGLHLNRVIIPTIQCTKDEVKFDPRYLRDPTAYLCINQDLPPFNLWGESNDDRANYIEIRVSCETNDCAQLSKQYKKLKINLSFKDQYFTPDNFEQPFTDIYRDKYIFFGLTENGIESNSNYDFNLQKITVITDKGWIQATNAQSNFMNFRDLQKSASTFQEKALFININTSSYRIIYEVIYQNIPHFILF